MGGGRGGVNGWGERRGERVGGEKEDVSGGGGGEREYE